MRFLISLVFVGVLAGQTAEKMLEAARHKEVMAGDLKGAIAEYRKIAAKFAGRPEVAAQALVKMGQCQEKLGESEARRSYERVVKEYAGAGAYAAQARARLAAMGNHAAGIERETRSRLLWDGLGQGLDAAYAWGIRNTTVDGRRVAFQIGNVEIGIRDLVTGEQRMVTNRGRRERRSQFAEQTLISPDGRHVVYLWGEDTGDKHGVDYSIRIVREDGTGERVLVEAKPSNTNAGRRYYYLDGWSPDGKWIAVQEEFSGQTSRIFLLSPDDGRTVDLFKVSAGFGYPGHTKFSPDGKWLALGGGRLREGGAGVFILRVGENLATPVEVVKGEELIAWTPDGSALLITRKRDNLHELHLQPVADGKAAGEATKLQSVPEFEGWAMGVSPGGAMIYKKMNRTAQGVVMEIDPGSAKTGATILRQQSGMWGPNVGRFSPDGKRALFVLSSGRVIIRTLETGTEYTILPQMRRMNRVEWAADNRSLLVSGIGRNGGAGLHRVDPDSGAASLVAAMDPNSVFAPAPDGTTVVASGSAGFSMIDVKAGTSQRPAWGDKAGRIADVRFSRDGKVLALFGPSGVQIVNVASGEVRRLKVDLDRFESGDWSPDGRFVLASARKGFFATRLVSIPVDGGASAVNELPGNYRGLRLSPDGKKVVLTEWLQHPQMWMMENFLPAK